MRGNGRHAPNPVIRPNQETDCARIFLAARDFALSNSLDFIGELSIFLGASMLTMSVCASRGQLNSEALAAQIRPTACYKSCHH